VDSSSVHHQEFFTVHAAMVCVVQVCRQLASKLSANHLGSTGTDGRIMLKLILQIYNTKGNGCMYLGWGPVAVFVNTVFNLLAPELLFFKF
jgi:hypothetical protein